jgi:predicted HicB family RNase H-like nuclease
MNDITRVTLRMTPELHAKIVRRAREKNLSANEWMIKALAHTLARGTHENIVIREVTL